MDDFRLLGTKEIAKLFGKHVQTVQKWRRDGMLPKPLIDTRSPVWSWYQIRNWIELNETDCTEKDSI
jgi:predicted DNA-binding transcriptional regulator AlpA